MSDCRAENALRVQPENQTPYTKRKRGDDDKRDGECVDEGKVELGLQHAHRVHAEPPKSDDAEIRDAEQAELNVEKEGEPQIDQEQGQ